MTSDEASEESEFLSALNASLQSFVHKDEKIECIHRIACHGRDVLAVLPAGLGKSAIYVLPPFSLIRDIRKQNPCENVSKISVNHACYRQIGSKFTNPSPLE